MRRVVVFSISFAIATWLAASTLALDVPRLSGWVNDYADLLSTGAEARISERLDALERDTGAQVVVLTIESLEGEVLEEYSLRVAESSKLGVPCRATPLCGW